MATTPPDRETLLNSPAGKPPPGVIPNLDDPPNLYVTGQVVLLLSYVLATLALLLRLYTKAFIIRLFKISDYSIILGWAVFSGYFAPSYMIGGIAPGVDQWNLRLRDFQSLLFYGHIGAVLYGVCIFFIKLSILLQFIEIFSPSITSRPLYWACHILIWVNFVFYFISTFLEIFACRPIAKVWDKTILTGTCIDTLVLNVAASSINSASDFIIFALPQMIIWKLHMSLRKRIAVSAVFLIGIFACVSSVVRLAYAVILFQGNDHNLSYNFFLAGIWTIPEMASGIIVACLPVSPKFFKTMKQSLPKVGYSLQSVLRLSTANSNRGPESFTMEGSDRSQLSHRWKRGGQQEEYHEMPSSKSSTHNNDTNVAMEFR